jgi:acyl carrier protein
MTVPPPTREAILAKLQEILSTSFSVTPERVTLQASLFTDLDLDSIDAVELAIQLQEITGRRLKAEEFKHVRTVEDVVEAVHQLLSAS